MTRGIWVKADGEAIYISQMDLPHLLNAQRRLVERKNEEGSDFRQTDLLDDLTEEIRKRGARAIRPRSPAMHAVQGNLTAFQSRWNELDPNDKIKVMHRLAGWLKEVDEKQLSMASDVLETWNPTPVTVEL